MPPMRRKWIGRSCTPSLKRQTISLIRVRRLQKKLATYFAIRQSSDEEAIRSSGATGGDQDRGADETGSTAASEKERKYEEQLSSIAKQQVKMSEAQANFDSQSLELQGRLDVKDQQAREIADKLFHWKRSVARSAVNSKTGKGIPKNFIDTMVGIAF